MLGEQSIERSNINLEEMYASMQKRETLNAL